jgi:hypothetical protein
MECREARFGEGRTPIIFRPVGRQGAEAIRVGLKEGLWSVYRDSTSYPCKWYHIPPDESNRERLDKESKVIQMVPLLAWDSSHSHRKPTNFQWILSKDSSLIASQHDEKNCATMYFMENASEEMIGTVYVSLARRHFKSQKSGWLRQTIPYYLLCALKLGILPLSLRIW